MNSDIGFLQLAGMIFLVFTGSIALIVGVCKGIAYLSNIHPVLGLVAFIFLVSLLGAAVVLGENNGPGPYKCK